LRPPARDDVPAIALLLADGVVAKHTTAISHPYSQSDAERFVVDALADAAAGLGVYLAIEERPAGRLVGMMGARIANGVATIGYWLGQEVWGRGLAGEALGRALRLLFDDFDVTAVAAKVFPANGRSLRVLQKEGFAFRGLGGGEELWSLERAAWQARRRARPLLLAVAAALIDVDGRVLLTSRPPGKSMAGQWEFPGGKMAEGETPEAALVRELNEELGIDVGASCLAPLAFASHDYDRFHLLMPLFACRRWAGQPQSKEGQRLAWVAPARLGDYPMPPADLPLVAVLRDWL
jgi:8-oxo-dGTP diphosphatase